MSIDTSLDIGTIFGVISIVFMIILGIRQWRKEVTDARKAHEQELKLQVEQSRTVESTALTSGANATKTYAEASALMAEQNKTLSLRVTTLEQRVEELEKELESVVEEKDSIKEWAEQLVKQIVGAGLVPIAYKLEKK